MNKSTPTPTETAPSPVPDEVITTLTDLRSKTATIPPALIIDEDEVPDVILCLVCQEVPVDVRRCPGTGCDRVICVGCAQSWFGNGEQKLGQNHTEESDSDSDSDESADGGGHHPGNRNRNRNRNQNQNQNPGGAEPQAADAPAGEGPGENEGGDSDWETVGSEDGEIVRPQGEMGEEFDAEDGDDVREDGKGRKCPLCRTGPLWEVELLQGRGALFSCILERVKIRCPYGSLGCEATGSVDNIVLHTASCPQRPVPCPNKECGCTQMFQQGQIEQHLPACEYRSEECSLCGKKFLEASGQEEHDGECPEAGVNCPNEGCKAKMTRKELAEHRSDCTFETLICPICLEVGIRRKEMVEHIAKPGKGHFEAMVAMMAEKDTLAVEQRSHASTKVEVQAWRRGLVVDDVSGVLWAQDLEKLKSMFGSPANEALQNWRHPDLAPDRQNLLTWQLEGLTAMQVACFHGDMATAKWLMEGKGVFDPTKDEDEDDYSTTDCRKLAAMGGHHTTILPWIARLQGIKTKTGVKNRGDEPLVLEAALGGKYETIKWLIKVAKLDPKYISTEQNTGRTALHEACRFLTPSLNHEAGQDPERLRVIDYLIRECQVEVYTHDNDALNSMDSDDDDDEAEATGFNCLHWACMNGNLEIAKHLVVKHKMDPGRTSRGAYENDALEWAEHEEAIIPGSKAVAQWLRESQ